MPEGGAVDTVTRKEASPYPLHRPPASFHPLFPHGKSQLLPGQELAPLPVHQFPHSSQLHLSSHCHSDLRCCPPTARQCLYSPPLLFHLFDHQLLLQASFTFLLTVTLTYGAV